MISTGLFAELYEGGNLSEEYALTFIAISLFYFIKEIMADSLKNQTYFFLGLMGGLVFFMRIHLLHFLKESPLLDFSLNYSQFMECHLYQLLCLLCILLGQNI